MDETINEAITLRLYSNRHQPYAIPSVHIAEDDARKHQADQTVAFLRGLRSATGISVAVADCMQTSTN